MPDTMISPTDSSVNWQPALSATSDNPASPPVSETVTPTETKPVDDKISPESEPGQDSDGDSSSPAPRPSRGVQKHIDKLRLSLTESETRESESRAREQAANDRLDKVLGALERQTATVTPTDGPPRPESFQNTQQFEEAALEWRVNQAVEAKVRRLEESRKEENIRAEAERTIKAAQDVYQERKTKFIENVSDFDEVVTDEVKISPTVGMQILNSDLGPQLAYHIARTPELADRLNRLGRDALSREIGKLEMQLTLQPIKPVSKASPPIVPSSSGETPPPRLDQMSMEDFAASRDKASGRR